MTCIDTPPTTLEAAEAVLRACGGSEWPTSLAYGVGTLLVVVLCWVLIVRVARWAR